MTYSLSKNQAKYTLFDEDFTAAFRQGFSVSASQANEDEKRKESREYRLNNENKTHQSVSSSRNNISGDQHQWNEHVEVKRRTPSNTMFNLTQIIIANISLQDSATEKGVFLQGLQYRDDCTIDFAQLGIFKLPTLKIAVEVKFKKNVNYLLSTRMTNMERLF